MASRHVCDHASPIASTRADPGNPEAVEIPEWVEDAQRISLSTPEPHAEPKLIACFPAGTLVHTSEGLVPIENIRIGMAVLSQSELGSERAYKRVITKRSFLDKEIQAIQIKVEGVDALTTIFCTLKPPFWVENILVDDEHWLAAECLAPDHILQLADGRRATVHAAGLIRRTQYEHIGIATDERTGASVVLDLCERQIALAGEAQAQNLDALQPSDSFLTPVYNFEVEDFHTYYGGENGIWVHNGPSGEGDSVQAPCFHAETKVAVEGKNGIIVGEEIAYISVGDEVLARSEITGEMSFKRVTAVKIHADQPVYDLKYHIDNYSVEKNNYVQGILVTREHPFWVDGKGWVEVRNLQIGDRFLTQDGSVARLVSLIPPESDVDCSGLIFSDSAIGGKST